MPREPALAHAREAEWNARRAVAMVEAKLDRATPGLIVADRSEVAQQQLADSVPPHLRPPAAFALASLGSVLLGQARPHEALGVLGVRRDARARAPDVRRRSLDARPGTALCRRRGSGARTSRPRCAVPDPNWRDANSPQLEAIDALRQEAAVVLDRVRNHERAREGRPFAGRTDIAGSLNACRGDWLGTASEQEGRIRYTLKQVQGRGRGLSVRAARREGPRLSGEQEKVYLRVWGGGAERLRLEAREEDGRRSDVITLAPTTSRFYYFAQLENEGGRPLSAPLALDPSAAPARAASPPCGGPMPRRPEADHARRPRDPRSSAPAPAEARRPRGSSPRPRAAGPGR